MLSVAEGVDYIMYSLLRLLLSFLALSQLFCLRIYAEETLQWHVGLARTAITPGEPIQMSGYAARTEPFRDIRHDLFAKVLVLEDKEKNRGVLITADFIGFYGALSKHICEGIEKATRIKRHQVLLTASHTHAGPVVTPSRGVDQASTKRIKRYVARLTEQIVAATVRAVADLRPARLSWGVGVAPFVMNRRQFTATGVRLGVQASGLADRSVPVFRVSSADGTLRCVVFGAACHNTTLTGKNLTLCGDYAGFAQYHIEQQHPGIQAMFMIGCAADANPYPRSTMALAEQHGKTLGTEVCRVLGSKLAPIQAPLRTLYREVDAPLQSIQTREAAQELADGKYSYLRYVGDKILATIDEGELPPKVYPVPLALWQLGDELTLVGISGETVVDYVKLTENAIGPLNLWVAGYCNDVFGYLPSARILEEGGYETRGLIRGGAGLFSPEAESMVVEEIRNMASDAGREF